MGSMWDWVKPTISVTKSETTGDTREVREQAHMKFRLKTQSKRPCKWEEKKGIEGDL